MGYSPWGQEESGMTEQLTLSCLRCFKCCFQVSEFLQNISVLSLVYTERVIASCAPKGMGAWRPGWGRGARPQDCGHHTEDVDTLTQGHSHVPGVSAAPSPHEAPCPTGQHPWPTERTREGTFSCYFSAALFSFSLYLTAISSPL